jgi:hypothetical protein
MKQAGPEFIGAYEHMREQQRGPGYEMVCRWGLVGWMERAAPFVPICSSPSPPARSLSSIPPEGVATNAPLSKGLYPELTRLLAEVAMSWLREERS